MSFDPALQARWAALIEAMEAVRGNWTPAEYDRFRHWLAELEPSRPAWSGPDLEGLEPALAARLNAVLDAADLDVEEEDDSL